MGKLACFGRIFGGKTAFLSQHNQSCSPSQKNKAISVAEAKSLGNFHGLFHLPLSEEAYNQYLILQQSLDVLQLSDDKDTWGFIWGSNFFSSSKVYKQLSGHCAVHAAFKWLWRSSCQNKNRVFFSGLSCKIGLIPEACLEEDTWHWRTITVSFAMDKWKETIEHLFISCPFASECWSLINLQVNQNLNPLQNLEWLRLQRKQKFFMEIIILFCWAIWMNNFIFRQIPPSTQGCKNIFRIELELMLCRSKKKYFPKIQEWINPLNQDGGLLCTLGSSSPSFS